MDQDEVRIMLGETASEANEKRICMFTSTKVFEKNRNDVSREPDYNRLLKILTEIRDFLNDLRYLSMGRDMSVLKRTGVVSNSIILDSATRTMESIRYCCMNANFADAYSLLRKFRDDLFYYVYLFAHWICIASHPAAKTAVQKYNLKESFDKLAEKLNNYIHSNGYSFYNESYNQLIQRKKVKEKCDEFSEVAIFVTVSFLFLVVLIRPLLITSCDYTDYLDVSATPPEDSQYWVAPIVSDFLCKYKHVLDENCDNYLKEKTGMQITNDINL